MFVAGIAGYLGGITGAVFRAFHVYAKERVVALVLIAALILAAGGLDAIVLLVAVDLLLAVMLLVEHRRIEGPSRLSST
jgi:hypothetical protein